MPETIKMTAFKSEAPRGTCLGGADRQSRKPRGISGAAKRNCAVANNPASPRLRRGRHAIHPRGIRLRRASARQEPRSIPWPTRVVSGRLAKANKAISASAGSGKTFRLAHRYMGLLARGVPPDRICALTFSRKAAGEIFDSIMRYLTAAAQDPRQAEFSAQYLESGRITTAEYRSSLRCLVENLHLANIGTIDSFIIGILRAFPLELGLNNPDFNLMDNDSADAESFRETVIAAACNAKRIKKTDANIFLESFRQAALGAERKTFAASLKKFLNDYRAAFLAIPAESSWGNPALIWEQAPWWLQPPPRLERKNLEQIPPAIAANSAWHKKMREGLTKLFGALLEFDSGSEWEPKIFMEGKIQGQIVKNLNRPAGAALKIEYAHKEYALPGDIFHAFRQLYHHLLHAQFARLFRQTKGIFNVIALYEKEYEQALLQTGNLTFTDAQLMLSPHGFASGGIVISRSPCPQNGRIFIDYRLDSKIDHWLLDEFQDTSNLQWQALENLVDEVLQDDSDTRSFFYVGDVKQTIYRWRGGNPDLFNGVLERYGKKIINEPLNETQRSAPPVIAAVNKVFARLPEARDDTAAAAIPVPALAKWNSAWKEHKCGAKAPADGYAALLQPVLPEGAKCHEPEAQLDLLARLLQHVNPAARELSAAILVRKNKTGKEIADYLRRYCPEMNISYEGETALLDSPVVTVLLDLLRYAEHPADNFAQQHLGMSPLGVWLGKNGMAFEALPLILLREIQAKGFKSVLRAWSARLGTLDAFGALRLEQMLEIAGEFDGRFDRNIQMFIKTVESFGMREASEARGCVHIMTIHQSKGLGFDLVILPDLNAHENINSAGAVDYLTGRSRDAAAPAWLLTIPDRKIAKCDATLQQSLAERDYLETMDNLCLLYVAMTRAKKALYMVTRIQERKFFNLAALLEQQLANKKSPRQDIPIGGIQADVLYETGNRNWFEKEKLSKARPEITPQPEKPASPAPARPAPLERIEPSLEEKVSLKASWLFRAESQEVLHFGSAIHELFRQVEWSANCRPDEIIRNWKPENPYPDIVRRDVKEQFLKVLTEPAVKDALAQPAGGVELWREKSFDVILDNKWISGIFDRVVILRNAAGNPVSARIMDYKSNRAGDPDKIKELAEIYKPQMTLYRQALARLLNLRADKIEAYLLFTVPRVVIKI